MNQFRHGYTNETGPHGPGLVQKAYSGADAEQRAKIEVRCLHGLTDRIPVPKVVHLDPETRRLTLQHMPGSHGQDLIEAGEASKVLRLLGSLLAELQRIDPAEVPGLLGSGDVVVHGDYGPQNVLVEGQHVSALLDWEFAHVGDPIEDLAWAEWIVRMHHPDNVDALADFFGAAGRQPPWSDRHAAMVQRCDQLLRRVEESGPVEATGVWSRRIATTEAWLE